MSTKIAMQNQVREQLDAELQAFLAKGNAIDKQEIIKKNLSDITTIYNKRNTDQIRYRKPAMSEEAKKELHEKHEQNRRIAKQNHQDTYQGARCKNGHYSRFVNTRTCAECPAAKKTNY